MTLATQPMRPEAVIFDLDGTLVDSFEDIATALNDTRAHWSLRPLPSVDIRREVGSGSEYLVRTLMPQVDPGEALGFYLERYEAVAVQQTRAFPGVEAVLDHFADRPLAVVTNKTQHLSRRILSALGLWNRFRIVLGGDALPERKPHPMPVQYVVRGLALEPRDVVLVGDGLHDVHAARAAGVQVVAVTTGVATRAELEAAHADVVIDRLDSLLALYR